MTDQAWVRFPVTLVEGPDGGNGDPLYTAAGQAVSFARALEYARRRLLTVATDELRARR